MKARELLEASKSVAIKDLFIVQDNSDINKKWIDKLTKAFKAGQKPEPVIIAELTPAVIKGLKKIRKLNDYPDSPYKDNIPEALVTTTKPFVLLDGNHRYLAAVKAGLTSLPVDGSTKISAGDIADFLHFGYF